MTGLSKSSLDIFKDCPLCFWLKQNKKVSRPQGIKASIMNGIDDGMKRSTDFSVAKKQPTSHYLKGIEGARPFRNRAQLATFMSWRTFQATVKAGPHTVLIWGQLDDLIEWEDHRVSAWDYKSNGQEREWEDYTLKYNSLQGDMYDILLPAQGLETTGYAYFTYTWPIVNKDGKLDWDHRTVSMKTDSARALQFIEAAVTCLEGPMPQASPSCEYCEFLYKRSLVTKK